jgi:hypothetical protein
MHCHAVDQYGQNIGRVSELPEATAPAEPRWQKLARGGFAVIFMAVWICGVLSFYSFGEAFKNGSPVPTSSHTEPLNNHGKITFITQSEKKRIDLLQLVSWVGIPSVMVSGLVLHFLIGVKLFPDTPTLSEYVNKRKTKPQTLP